MRHVSGRSHGPAVCGLRLRLRLSIDPAACRRSEDLPLRYLTVRISWSGISGKKKKNSAGDLLLIQRAIVLQQLGNLAKSDTAQISRSPSSRYRGGGILLLVLGDYDQLSRQYDRNSVWAATFLLIAAALLRLLYAFRGLLQVAIAIAVAGVWLSGVPRLRRRADVFRPVASGSDKRKRTAGHLGGLHDVSTRWFVTHDFAQWKDEIAWMSLYFSAAVWSSLALCSFALVKNRLPLYQNHAYVSVAGRRFPVRIGRGSLFEPRS